MNRTWLLVAAVVVFGVGGWAIWQSATPPENAGRSAPATGDAAANATEPGAPLAEVKLPESFSPQAEMGRRVFEAKCASCHGRNAAGQAGVAPPLVHQIYRPAHHADIAFLLAAKNGVQAHHWRFGNMPPVEAITEGEVRLVIRYIRELQQANGIR